MRQTPHSSNRDEIAHHNNKYRNLSTLRGQKVYFRKKRTYKFEASCKQFLSNANAIKPKRFYPLNYRGSYQGKKIRRHIYDNEHNETAT